MRESIRLEPPTNAISVEAKEDTLIAGKYQVYKGEAIIVLQTCVQRDPAVWGDDVRPRAWESRAADASRRRRSSGRSACSTANSKRCP